MGNHEVGLQLSVGRLFGCHSHRRSASFCVWPSDVGSEEFTGEVTGISSYNRPKLDLKMEEMADRGIRPGAMFDIEADGVTYEDAILFDNYQEIFMFDIYVNIESDGYVSIGCMGKLIVLEVGTEVKLTHSGNSYRYSKTPITTSVPQTTGPIIPRKRPSLISSRSPVAICSAGYCIDHSACSTIPINSPDPLM